MSVHAINHVQSRVGDIRGSIVGDSDVVREGELFADDTLSFVSDTVKE